MLPAKVSEHLIFWRFRAPWPSGSWSVWLSSRQHFILLLSIICFHYNLFSQEIIPLHGTIFYRKSVYVLWIYSYIYIYILSLQRNSKMKCSINLLLPLTKRRSGFLMLWGFSVCHTHPWHKKFQSSEANCPLSSKKMFNKKTFLKAILHIFCLVFIKLQMLTFFNPVSSATITQYLCQNWKVPS